MPISAPTSDTASLVLDAYQWGQDLLATRSNEVKKAHGQFLSTPALAQYMAGRLNLPAQKAHVLDPAVGSGVLLCAVVERAIQQGYPDTLVLTGYEIDEPLSECARSALKQAQRSAEDAGITVRFNIQTDDFILAYAPNDAPSLFEANAPSTPSEFDAIIANPPYFKLRRDTPQVQAVEGFLEGGTNIYTLFMGLAARLLSSDGHACFIVPRSFCSGAYFKSFRTDFLDHATPNHVHLFTSRSDAFDADSVLQENVIIAFSRTDPDEAFDSLTLSTSQGLHDLNDARERHVSATIFVGEGHRSIYYRLPTTELDESIVSALDAWEASFASHGFAVSTGPVVAFRNRPLLTDADDVSRSTAVPLYWMQNIQPGSTVWPTDRGSKPQGLRTDSEEAETLTLPVTNYVLIRRFSSKEDRRRLTAAPFLADEHNYDAVSFENHLNYLSHSTRSLSTAEVYGLTALLNSALVDRYFRILNGNTQVNATDLKSLPLPDRSAIAAIGQRVYNDSMAKANAIVFDTLRNRGYLPDTLPTFTETRFTVGKLQDAQEILQTLGLPRRQQNELSALTLLVLAQLSEKDDWSDAMPARLGISEMMDEMAKRYDRRYAENTRESVRKNVIHQFVQAALVERNPDDPSLPTNSPNTHYALTEEAVQTLRSYNTDEWENTARQFLEEQRSLIERYQRKRNQERVPLTLPSGEAYTLSPGAHNKLQVAIIEEFGPRFAPGAEVLYVGDTANKTLHLDESGFEALNIPVPAKEKLPDVVLYAPNEHWIYFIEAVTSRGPISPKRQVEIEQLILSKTTASPIFVSAFPDFSTFRSFIGDIAWETEVWIADRPSHMIHFNGDKFVGPHSA